MDVVAHLEAPHAAAAVFEVVDDLSTYPDWLDIVSRAKADDDGAWLVDLRGRLGPFARSKRLRMARAERVEDRLVVFERAELDGRDHSPWVLRAELEPNGDDACRLTMRLHYGGGLWGPVLERLLGDAITHSRPRLLALLDARSA